MDQAVIRAPRQHITKIESLVMNGVLILNKPQSVSSAWYVYLLRPVLDLKRIGHAGSLDPFAEGVLLACVGRATKMAESLMDLPKHYRATVHLGVTNACHDTELPIEPLPDARQPSDDQMRRALVGFQGHIEQIPPTFSALQIGGIRAYDLARFDQPVPIAPRPVHIHSLQLREYTWPWLTFDVLCGRGTYIRALVRDIGRTLGCGGICTRLQRMSVGPFDLSQAVRIRGLSRRQVEDRIISPDRIAEIVARYRQNPPQTHLSFP